MRFNKIKALILALAIAVAAATAAPLSACSKSTKLSFLKTQGELIVNEDGEEVTLRGVNAGGLFVIEAWMTGFTRGWYEDTNINYRDHRTVTQVFLDRFGKEKTKELWAEYRANWWSEDDFKNCAEMGVNVIRLPFTYMSVDFDAIESYDNAGRKYDFSALDEFVQKAADYGIYTILDLHGAYGSQNGQDHSGETRDSVNEVGFYTNERMMNLTANLWGALAKHYKNNPNVAGYDILNEPGEKGGSTSKVHWDFFDMAYDAIREQDKNHIVIFESCWAGNNLPQPKEYGWENCMYSFHHYTSTVDDYEKHCTDFNNRITDILSMNFGVPLQMGEFTCYNNLNQWEYTLGALNRAGIHWVTWTYKIWGTSPWGVVNVTGTNKDKVDAASDGYEEIITKFQILKTSGDTPLYTFKRDGKEITLFETIRKYCIDSGNEIDTADYLVSESVSGTKLSMESTVGGKAVLGAAKNWQEIITVSEVAANGSVTLLINGQPLSAITVGDTVYVGFGGSTANAQFFSIETDEGYIFIAYSNCKYLTLGDDGIIRAEAEDINKATIFNLEKI